MISATYISPRSYASKIKDLDNLLHFTAISLSLIKNRNQSNVFLCLNLPYRGPGGPLLTNALSISYERPP